MNVFGFFKKKEPDPFIADDNNTAEQDLLIADSYIQKSKEKHGDAKLFYHHYAALYIQRARAKRPSITVRIEDRTLQPDRMESEILLDEGMHLIEEAGFDIYEPRKRQKARKQAILKAREVIERATGLCDIPTAHYLLTVAYQHDPVDLDKSIEHMQKAVAMQPDNLQWRDRLNGLLSQKK